MKNISEMEWNSFVCFTVDKENGREPAKQQWKGKNRTRHKLLLCFLSELLCISVKLKNKQLRLLIVLGLTHILTVIYIFNNRFYEKADTSFSLSFSGKCVAANFSILKNLQ